MHTLIKNATNSLLLCYSFLSGPPSPTCSLVKYSSWEEMKHEDVGILWAPLEFTPTIVTKIR